MTEARSLADKHIHEIADVENLRAIDRSVPRGRCVAWCGRQVVPGKIFCSPCLREWTPAKTIGWNQSDWVEEQRKGNLPKFGIPIYEHMAVWKEWT